MEDTLSVSAIEQVSQEIFKIFSSEGPVFFVRTRYLKIITKEALEKSIPKADFLRPLTLSKEESDDIMSAAFAFTAEKKAESYLERCEQSRFGLTQKLLQKGIEKDSIKAALDFLEEKNYLSDSRFAESWLRMHAITKAHGRRRLLNELLTRGIDKKTANEALDTFFEENSEEELCEKAYEKAVRQKKSGEKLLKFMLDAGFDYKMVKSVIQEDK